MQTGIIAFYVKLYIELALKKSARSQCNSLYLREQHSDNNPDKCENRRNPCLCAYD